MKINKRRRQLRVDPTLHTATANATNPSYHVLNFNTLCCRLTNLVGEDPNLEDIENDGLNKKICFVCFS